MGPATPSSVWAWECTSPCIPPHPLRLDPAPQRPVWHQGFSPGPASPVGWRFGVHPASPCPVHLGMIRGISVLHFLDQLGKGSCISLPGSYTPDLAGLGVLHPFPWILHSVNSLGLGIRIVPRVLHPVGWLRMGVKLESCNPLLCFPHINGVWGCMLGPAPFLFSERGGAPQVLHPLSPVLQPLGHLGMHPGSLILVSAQRDGDARLQIPQMPPVLQQGSPRLPGHGVHLSPCTPVPSGAAAWSRLPARDLDPGLPFPGLGGTQGAAWCLCCDIYGLSDLGANEVICTQMN